MAQFTNAISNSFASSVTLFSLENDGSSNILMFQKSRDEGVITSGDTLGGIFLSGFDGTNYIPAAKILSTSSGTIAAGRVAGNLVFQTHPDAATPAVTRFTINSTGTIVIAAPDSGNSLTVSQLGNGVVLSSSTGVITSLNTAAANTVLTSNGVGVAPSWQVVPSSSVDVIPYTSVNHAASPYTALSTDYYISADVTAGTVSILLPNAPVTGRVFVVKDKVGLAATSNITITTVGGVITLDGSTSYTMNTAYEVAQFVFNGTSYEVF